MIDSYRDRIREQLRVVQRLTAPNSNVAAHLWLLERALHLGHQLDGELTQVEECAAQEPGNVQALLLPALHELGVRIEAMQHHRLRSWDTRCTSCGEHEREGDLVGGVCPSCRQAAEDAKRYREGSP